MSVTWEWNRLFCDKNHKKIGHKYRNIVEKYRNNERFLYFFLKIVVRTQFYLYLCSRKLKKTHQQPLTRHFVTPSPQGARGMFVTNAYNQ